MQVLVQIPHFLIPSIQNKRDVGDMSK